MSQPKILGRPSYPIGYGMLGLTWRGTPKPFEESIQVMKEALNLGANNWNAGEIYGTPDRNSLHLLAQYFDKYPEDAERIILNVKGGMKVGQLAPDGSERNIRRSVDECNRILGGRKTIDIFEMARVDLERGNQEAIDTLTACVKEGKIKAIGLSEVSAKTIRAAHQQAQAMIASVEVELSLWTPDILGNGIAATCAELDIPIFAYSPLARGAITDSPIRSNADIPDGDVRKILPRYQDDVLAANNKLTDAVIEIARKKDWTAAQVAIAWVRGQSGRTRTVRTEDGQQKTMKLGTIIPIPGASTVERVRENLKDLTLTEEELGELDGLVDKHPVRGDRYHGPGMHHVNA